MENIKDKLLSLSFPQNLRERNCLNICRSVIESHHGKLWFENQIDNGCIFFFSIPSLSSEPNSIEIVKDLLLKKISDHNSASGDLIVKSPQDKDYYI